MNEFSPALVRELAWQRRDRLTTKQRKRHLLPRPARALES